MVWREFACSDCSFSSGCSGNVQLKHCKVAGTVVLLGHFCNIVVQNCIDTSLSATARTDEDDFVTPCCSQVLSCCDAVKCTNATLCASDRADEGDFVNLQQKHNFSMAHFGMMLGMLRTTLSELQIQHCNDFFSMGQGALSAISCLPRLRVLRIEDLHCRVDKAALAELARLTQVGTPLALYLLWFTYLRRPCQAFKKPKEACPPTMQCIPSAAVDISCGTSY